VDLFVQLSTLVGLASGIVTILQGAFDFMRSRVRAVPPSAKPWKPTALITPEIGLPTAETYRWDFKMSIFLMAFSPLVAFWGVYTCVYARSFSPAWPAYAGGTALVGEAALLAATGARQFQRVRRRDPDMPLNHSHAELTLEGPRSEIRQACIRAMLSIGALGTPGSQITTSKEKGNSAGKDVLQGGTGRWSSAGRGSRVTVTVDAAGRLHGDIALFKVDVSSESYRADLFDSYRNKRNTRNVVRQLLN
jgi:hypothetical protein